MPTVLGSSQQRTTDHGSVFANDEQLSALQTRMHIEELMNRQLCNGNFRIEKLRLSSEATQQKQTLAMPAWSRERETRERVYTSLRCSDKLIYCVRVQSPTQRLKKLGRSLLFGTT